MPRYEVRFYDALNDLKVTVELPAADEPAAELAARVYLRSELAEQLATFGLVLGVVRPLR